MVKKSKLLLLYVFPVIWALTTLYPLFITFISSLKGSNAEIFGNMARLPRTLHFENYARALYQADMANCVFNSFILASGSTIVLLIIAAMVSFCIAYFRCKFTSVLYVMFLFGMLLPIHATIIPLARIMGRIGGFNNYPVLMLLYAAFGLPLAVFILSGYMKGISTDIYDAAFIDGCGPLSALYTIVLPISKPAIATSAIISFLFVYNDLIFALMFISDRRLFTISLGLFSFVGFRTVEFAPIFASIIIAIVPMIVVYVLFHDRVQRGMLAGAVKG